MLVGHKYSKSVLYNIAKDAILESNRYLTRTELCKITGVHHSQFHKYGVVVHDVNLELGYVRKGLMNTPSAEDRDKFLTSLVEQYKNCITKKGRSVSLYEFSKETLVTYSTLYRYKLNVKQIHLECGIDYNVYDTSIPNEAIIQRLTDMIVSKKRYISYIDLSRDLRVSHSLLCFRGIPVREINISLGYKPDFRALESYVLELLWELLPGVKIEREKTFDGCAYISKLRFDFFIPNMKVLIEVDGPSHWNPSSKFYSAGNVIRDNIKNKFALDNGYYLLRIRSSEISDKQSLLTILSGTPLKQSIGQSAAKPEIQEGSETIRKE